MSALVGKLYWYYLINATDSYKTTYSFKVFTKRIKCHVLYPINGPKTVALALMHEHKGHFHLFFIPCWFYWRESKKSYFNSVIKAKNGLLSILIVASDKTYLLCSNLQFSTIKYLLKAFFQFSFVERMEF